MEDDHSLKPRYHQRVDLFVGLLELRNLNHLRKLFDLEPVANTWQAGMVKMTVHGAGVIYVFSGHCC